MPRSFSPNFKTTIFEKIKTPRGTNMHKLTLFTSSQKYAKPVYSWKLQSSLKFQFERKLSKRIFLILPHQADVFWYSILASPVIRKWTNFQHLFHRGFIAKMNSLHKGFKYWINRVGGHPHWSSLILFSISDISLKQLDVDPNTHFFQRASSFTRDLDVAWAYTKVTTSFDGICLTKIRI